jgi:formylglycine-generating enzyme required for sulfatase activity
VRVFLSYSSKDRELVEPIALTLNGQGHNVFFDREDLPAAEEYDGRIRKAIENSGLFVFLVSPNSIRRGSYALAELEIARKNWPHPSGRVLPVVLRETPFDQVPAYLTAVTVLEPQGNVAAAVADEVQRVAHRRSRRILVYGAAGAAAVAIGVALLWPRSSAITGQDGAIALPVPEGRFVMGDDENSLRREVFLSGFYLDQHEVTASRFAKFLRATGSGDWTVSDLEVLGEQPMTGVSWHEADAYCQWAGKRLPTDAEWEKAARGTDERRYPWGNDAPGPQLATFAKSEAEPFSPVASHEAGKSPYGMYDMAGNAAEWVADWYSEGYESVRNPKGAERGDAKVIRGGSAIDPVERIATTHRMHAKPHTRLDDTGFRCAQDLSK